MCANDFILNKMAGKEKCACSSCFETTEYTCLRCERLKKKKNLFLMCTRTSNRQNFPIQAISKAKPQDFSEQKSSKTTFEENITLFKQKLRNRGYLDNLIDKTLSEVNLRERMLALQNKLKTRKNILRFVMEYRPSVPNLKQFR